MLREKAALKDIIIIMIIIKVCYVIKIIMIIMFPIQQAYFHYFSLLVA